MIIQLPISKSIAQRVLILQALHDEPLLSVDPAVDPEDVCLLHDILAEKLHTGSDSVCARRDSTWGLTPRLDVQNNGTAMRFLTAFFAQREDCHVVLDGCERMHQRPIGQLVDALIEIGADIRYLGEEGFPPLEIHGRSLNLSQPVHIRNPKSTQFVSALLLIGANVSTNIISPYIELTKSVIRDYKTSTSRGWEERGFERDWSAAAFWLERWTLGLCEEPEFPGLREDSMQGDRVARELFATIREMSSTPAGEAGRGLSIDFTAIPDLYPAVAITCEQLGIRLNATGVESLRIKESDRLEAIRQHRTYGDHRIAMALLAANMPCDDIDCIRKSYPQFYEQLCSVSR